VTGHGPGLRGEEVQKLRILKQILESQSPELLGSLDAIRTGRRLSDETRELLREAVAAELVERGLTPDDEVSPHGKVLEDLIDWLGTK
jgi:hypothetical protein